MIADPFRNPTGVIPRVRRAELVGAAAGNHTLTGISVQNDRLLSVRSVTFTLTEGVPNTINTFAVADLTSEFSITADNTINNTGGTDTTGRLLIVEYYDYDYGETSEAPWNA